MEKVVFQVGGLKCGSCVSSIKTKLEEIEGVGSALPDRGESNVAVEYDPALVNIDNLKQIIIGDGLTLED